LALFLNFKIYFIENDFFKNFLIPINKKIVPEFNNIKVIGPPSKTLIKMLRIVIMKTKERVRILFKNIYQWTLSACLFGTPRAIAPVKISRIKIKGVMSNSYKIILAIKKTQIIQENITLSFVIFL